MSNYHFHYIKNHFKDVHPGHPNCETGLNFDHLAMFGAFDPENTNPDNAFSICRLIIFVSCFSS